ncbi:MAG: LiaI-LiaF-like domain-containing protein [Vicinamibacterales bacterium]
MESRSGFRVSGQLVLGVSIAILGVLFTLDNLHILRARDYLQFWPLALIAIGLVHVAQARTGAGTIGGGIWILVGVVLLGNRLGFFPANILSFWPLILVLVGARIVWQTLGSNRAADRGDTSATVSAIAVMGGFDRRIASHEFRGGEITAFMGGGKLDLRDAIPVGGQAVINIFAVMGGFEVVVPETWRVVSEVTPFMGGIEDKSRTSTNPSAPCLILRGFVMMGGVTLKNP